MILSDEPLRLICEIFWLGNEVKVRMRPVRVILLVLLFAFFVASGGCERITAPFGRRAKADNDLDRFSVYDRYAPAKIDILPLTELISVTNAERAKIHLYVSLLDAFGSQIKWPGTFRFELYEHVQRSAEPKGKRVAIWPDIDLADPAANNEYWRDFLRAYEFNLPFEQAGGQGYILQVTCLCTGGKRLSSEFTLRHAE